MHIRSGNKDSVLVTRLFPQPDSGPHQSIVTTKIEYGADWDVWTDWHHSILNGKPTPGGDELDLYRVTLDEPDDWLKGSPHVNALIRMKQELRHRQDKKNTQSFDFFISYSTVDEPFARWVASILERNGKTVFAQFKDFSNGSSIPEKMNIGLERASQMIALYSPAYEESKHCQAEWNTKYFEDPSGEQGKLRPFLILPTKLKALAKQFIYTSLVGLSGADAERSVLAALGIGAPGVTTDVAWPGERSLKHFEDQTAHVFEVGLNPNATLAIRPPIVEADQDASFTSAELFSFLAAAINRFLDDIERSDGNHVASESLINQIRRVQVQCDVSVIECKALSLNDELSFLIRLVEKEEFEGALQSSSKLSLHKREIKEAYRRLSRIFPNLHQYRQLRQEDRFESPDQGTELAFNEVRAEFEKEAKRPNIIDKDLSEDFSGAIRKASELSRSNEIASSIQEKQSEIDAYRGVAARAAPIWDTVANIKSKIKAVEDTAEDLAGKVGKYEKLYKSLAPSMVKVFRYLMDWI